MIANALLSPSTASVNTGDTAESTVTQVPDETLLGVEVSSLVLCSPNESQLQEKYDLLLKDYENLQNTFSESKKTMRDLKRSISRLQKKVKSSKKIEAAAKVQETKYTKLIKTHKKEKRLWERQNKKKEDFMTGAKKIFTDNQIKLISGTQSRVRWTSDEISQAFTIRYCGIKGYIFMKNELHYPLPGTKYYLLKFYTFCK